MIGERSIFKIVSGGGNGVVRPHLRFASKFNTHKNSTKKIKKIFLSLIKYVLSEFMFQSCYMRINASLRPLISILTQGGGGGVTARPETNLGGGGQGAP